MFVVFGGLVLDCGCGLLHSVCQRFVDSCRIGVLYHLLRRDLRSQWSRHMRAMCFWFILKWRRCRLHVMCGRHVVSRPRRGVHDLFGRQLFGFRRQQLLFVR